MAGFHKVEQNVLPVLNSFIASHKKWNYVTQSFDFLNEETIFLPRFSRLDWFYNWK